MKQKACSNEQQVTEWKGNPRGLLKNGESFMTYSRHVTEAKPRLARHKDASERHVSMVFLILLQNGVQHRAGEAWITATVGLISGNCSQ